MNLAHFSVNRPIFTIMAVLIVIILGIVSLSRLPIDLMPDITYPALSVRTAYENAGAEEIEELVTRPVEEALSAVPGVEEVTSTSAEGMSSVRVTLSWGTDLDAASNDIRDRLDRILSRLPDDADRPRLFKFDLASFPILILGAYSSLDPIQMREMIEDQVKYRIERVDGVASFDIWGGLSREIQVNLYESKVKSVGVTIDEVLARIAAANINFPAGSIDRGAMEITVRTSGEFSNLDELRNTVVAIRDGAPILLKEIAEVKDSWGRVREIIRVNGQPGFRLAVTKQSGTNTVRVADAVLAELVKINRDLPQLNLIPIVDTSDFIKRAIRNMAMAAIFGGTLAILVLLFFLRNIRSTLVMATAIPISIIATFVLMYFGGFTLNIMTLGGLALGVGMLMDNSIVVLENIFRMREGGLGGKEAAIDGSSEVAAPIVASTLTTIVVFLPLIFVQGMAGVMFKQLAIVVGFALFCSLAVAITLVPMLASRLLRIGNGTGRGLPAWLSGQVNRFLLGIEGSYKAALHRSLDHRLIVTVAAVLLLVGSLALVPYVGSELMPASDEGEVRVNIDMAVGTRVDVTDTTVKKIEDAVRAAVPEIKSIVTSVGSSGWHGGGGQRGSLRIALVPQAQRKRSSDEIANMLRGLLKDIPGAEIRTRAGAGLFIFRMMTPSGEKINIEIRGHDIERADQLAAAVQDAVKDVASVTDTDVSRKTGMPEVRVRVDRDKAADMKLTVSQIASLLQTVLSGTVSGYYREAGKEYRILVKLKDSERLSIEEIMNLNITNSDGRKVVLRNVLSTHAASGPVTIERKDQERIVNVAVNISGERDMGSVIADMQKKLDAIPRDRDFTVAFSGDFEEQQKAFRELLLSFVLALVLVYMVMACQFESLRDPFVVMFAVPLAVIGVVLMLLFTRTTFNIQSFIGCIMLAGIVVNNAILLVDHTNLLRRRDGMALRDAIEEAGRRRLRPILMTASTTMLGLLPLAIGLGEGGEAQAPLARAVIGGLMSSTLITLVFVPVVYSVFERKAKH